MKKTCVTLILSLALFSCAGKQQEVVKKRFFWPPPPDEPKVEFIGTYGSSKDLPKKESFLKKIIGDMDIEVRLRKPLGIGADGEGRVVITDMIPGGGTIWDFNSNTAKALAEDSAFGLASGVEFDSSYLYIADAKMGNIKVFNKKNLEPAFTIGDGELESPSGLAVNERLNRLYVVDTKSSRVVVFDTQTKSRLLDFGKPGDREGEFNRPWGVCIDKQGDVYISDGLNARIQIFDKDGKFLSMFGKRGDKPGGFAQVKGIGLDSDGNIYIIDPLKAVQVFNREGQLLGLVGAPGNRGIGAMNLPMGLYVDKNDRIYVVDQLNRLFHVFQYMNEKYKKENPVTKK